MWTGLALIKTVGEVQAVIPLNTSKLTKSRVKRVVKRTVRRIVNPNLKKPLFFVHIPKCAGTSFKDYVKLYLANWRTEIIDTKGLQDTKHYSHLEKDLPDGFHVSNMTRSEYIRLRLLEPRKNRIIMGHICFYEYMKGLNYSFATFLRDPVGRIISHYYWFHEEEADFHSLEDWLNSSKTELNLQTAFLCGNPKTKLTKWDLEMAKVNLHFFDFIGIVEYFDSSLKLFSRIYQTRLPNKISVLNTNLKETYKRKNIPQDIVNLIVERSCYDIELYEHACKLFNEKLRVAGLFQSAVHPS